MFCTIGALGILLALVWFPLIRNRSQVSLSTQEEVRLGSIPTPATQPTHIVSAWTKLFRSRTIWGLMLGFGGINYTGWLYLNWLPAYLQTERHVSIAQTGWLATLPFLAGSLGMLASGSIADRIISSGRSAVAVHRSHILFGMLVSALSTLFVSHASTTSHAVAGISFALFCIHFAGTSAWGYVQTASPATLVASASALQNFGSFLYASTAPLLTGWLLDRTHSFRIALVTCSAMTLLGAIAFFLLANGVIETQSRASGEANPH